MSPEVRVEIATEQIEEVKKAILQVAPEAKISFPQSTRVEKLQAYLQSYAKRIASFRELSNPQNNESIFLGYRELARELFSWAWKDELSVHLTSDNINGLKDLLIEEFLACTRNKPRSISQNIAHTHWEESILQPQQAEAIISRFGLETGLAENQKLHPYTEVAQSLGNDNKSRARIITTQALRHLSFRMFRTKEHRDTLKQFFDEIE